MSVAAIKRETSLTKKHWSCIRRTRASLPAVLLWIVAVTAVLPERAAAQSFGRMVPERRVEVGYANARMERGLRYESGLRTEVDWGRQTAFVRGTIGTRLTVGIDAFVWHTGQTVRFPRRDYYDVTAGAQVVGDVMRLGPVQVRAGVRYAAHVWLDQSPDRQDKRTTQTQVALVAERRFALRDGMTGSIWGGPAHTRDVLYEYPSPPPRHRIPSENDWGALAGGQVILGRRLRLFGEAAYARYWQWSGGVAAGF